MKSILSVSLLLGLGACAVPPQEPEKLAENERLVCAREQPTGLVQRVTVCRKVIDTQMQTKESREMMDNVRQPPAAIR